MKTIELPASMKYIAQSALAGCSSLDSIVCLAPTPPEVAAKTSFATASFSGVLMVPAGAKIAYESDDIWKNFKDIRELESTAVECLPADLQPVDERIFTLDGRFVGRDLSALRRGVYVRGAKKILK